MAGFKVCRFSGVNRKLISVTLNYIFKKSLSEHKKHMVFFSSLEIFLFYMTTAFSTDIMLGSKRPYLSSFIHFLPSLGETVLAMKGPAAFLALLAVFYASVVTEKI